MYIIIQTFFSATLQRSVFDLAPYAPTLLLSRLKHLTFDPTYKVSNNAISELDDFYNQKLTNSRDILSNPVSSYEIKNEHKHIQTIPKLTPRVRENDQKQNFYLISKLYPGVKENEHTYYIQTKSPASAERKNERKENIDSLTNIGSYEEKNKQYLQSLTNLSTVEPENEWKQNIQNHSESGNTSIQSVPIFKQNIYSTTKKPIPIASEIIDPVTEMVTDTTETTTEIDWVK